MRLGSDPEVFVLKGDKLTSIIGFIGANKHAPLQIEGMAPGFTLQEDNVALEFGIPPAASADEFIRHIQDVQAAFLKRLPEFTFSKLSCSIFPEDQMESPLAHIFGCEPDYNAWTGKENKKPEPPHPYMRSAGGHVHIETDLNKREVIKAVDLFLGIPSLFMDAGDLRREMYGKAGAFRPKPYGAEYRTLSNFWIFDPKTIKWVWDNTQRALDFVDTNHIVPEITQIAINNNDLRVAKQLVDEYSLEVL